MVIKIIITILTLLYPLVVFYGLKYYSIQMVSLCVLAVFILRSLSVYLLKNKQSSHSNQFKQDVNSSQLSEQMALKKILPLIILLLLGGSFVLDSQMGLLLYPVVINAVLAITFYYSLISPPPIIERLARLTKPDLPEHAITYTRKVTVVWLCFFVFNGLVACYTAFYCDLATWTLYNGFIAYLLMGILFAVEYMVRLRVQKKHED
jgi:uncharacterized membrane protein